MSKGRIPGTNIVVDAFTGGGARAAAAPAATAAAGPRAAADRAAAAEPCFLYFLSHAHSDHTAGLHDRWNAGPLYCSPVTAAIVTLRMPALAPVLRPLALDAVHILPLVPAALRRRTTGAVTARTELDLTMRVTLIDANHCPGAVMFLFQSPAIGTVLHTGDCCYTPRWAAHPALAAVLRLSHAAPSVAVAAAGAGAATSSTRSRHQRRGDGSGGGGGRDCAGLRGTGLDRLYLDNTFAQPSMDFADRGVGTAEAIAIVQANPTALVVIAVDSLGKEELCLAIARACGERVLVSADRLALMRTYGDAEIDAGIADGTFTTEPMLARLRVMSKHAVTASMLRQWNQRTGDARTALAARLLAGIDRERGGDETSDGAAPVAPGMVPVVLRWWQPRPTAAAAGTAPASPSLATLVPATASTGPVSGVEVVVSAPTQLPSLSAGAGLSRPPSHDGADDDDAGSDGGAPSMPDDDGAPMPGAAVASAGGGESGESDMAALFAPRNFAAAPARAVAPAAVRAPTAGAAASAGTEVAMRTSAGGESAYELAESGWGGSAVKKSPPSRLAPPAAIPASPAPSPVPTSGSGSSGGQAELMECRRTVPVPFEQWEACAPVIAIVPTGWVSVRRPFDGHSTYTVPYSLHCSFSQLVEALRLLRPRECQATSNVTPAAMSRLHALVAPYLDRSPPSVPLEMRRTTSETLATSLKTAAAVWSRRIMAAVVTRKQGTAARWTAGSGAAAAAPAAGTAPRVIAALDHVSPAAADPPVLRQVLHGWAGIEAPEPVILAAGSTTVLTASPPRLTRESATSTPTTSSTSGSVVSQGSGAGRKRKRHRGSDATAAAAADSDVRSISPLLADVEDHGDVGMAATAAAGATSASGRRDRQQLGAAAVNRFGRPVVGVHFGGSASAGMVKSAAGGEAPPLTRLEAPELDAAAPRPRKRRRGGSDAAEAGAVVVVASGALAAGTAAANVGVIAAPPSPLLPAHAVHVNMPEDGEVGAHGAVSAAVVDAETQLATPPDDSEATELADSPDHDWQMAGAGTAAVAATRVEGAAVAVADEALLVSHRMAVPLPLSLPRAAVAAAMRVTAVGGAAIG